MCYLQALRPAPIPLAAAFDLTLSRSNRLHFVHLLAKGKQKAAAAKAAAAKAAAAKAAAAKAKNKQRKAQQK